MSASQTLPADTEYFSFENRDCVLVVTIQRKKLLDEEIIAQMGTAMFALVDEQGWTKIVLDFRLVEYMSSAFAAKLLTMDKKLKAANGTLRLCKMRHDIFEVFAIMRLNKVFDIRDTLDDAFRGI